MDNFDLRKYLAEGRLFEEDFKNPILDKYLELKKSVDNNTAFEYELSDFINDLDNTEREGLESDLGLERDELYEGKLFEEEQWFDPSSPSHGKGYKILGDEPQEGAFYVSGYDFENDKSFEYYVLDPNYNKYLTATQELLGLADEQDTSMKV